MLSIKHRIGIVCLAMMALTACDVVKLDAKGNPIIPVDPKEQHAFKNMSPQDIAQKVWPQILVEVKTKSIHLNQAIQSNKQETVNFFVVLDGQVLDLKKDGLKNILVIKTTDGDVALNLGPVILNNAIRDASKIINFDEFKNQVQFARFSKELNKKAIHNFKHPDQTWVNQPIHIIAAMSINNHKVLAAVPIFLDRG